MAPGAVEDAVPNGTTEVACRSNGDTHEIPNKESSTVATTNGHAQEQHQRCCCCCQLRSKGDAKSEAKDKDDPDKDSAKEKEEEGKDGEKTDKENGDAEQDKEPEDETMKCEIKHLDRKYDDKDEAFFAEVSNITISLL